MPLTQQQLGDPSVLNAVSRLEFHAREVMEGFISGLHKSPYHGFSVEFAQHREYTVGDEIRYIDWKVAARSDRYYIKEFEEETNLKSYLLVDTSESMLYQGRKKPFSKLEYASIMAAGLATILIQQRDAAGLVLFNDGMQKYVPPRATASHFTQMLEELATAQTKPKSELAPTFHEVAERIKRRGLVVIFSDLFGDLDDVLGGLRHFRHRGHEVVLFQILDEDETTFPFDDLTKFEGLELEPEQLVDPRGIREEYLRNFNEFCSELERRCREIRVDVVRTVTTEAPADALSHYLAGRMRRT
ncbi:MAG: vWA domain-containing protein [Armatimonadetes bacterium]|jgi:uncharacterized protein (DUF58 family)|nr:vWA domain-containing protein [Armatimonadota bacterium]